MINPYDPEEEAAIIQLRSETLAVRPNSLDLLTRAAEQEQDQKKEEDEKNEKDKKESDLPPQGRSTRVPEMSRKLLEQLNAARRIYFKNINDVQVFKKESPSTKILRGKRTGNMLARLRAWAALVFAVRHSQLRREQIICYCPPDPRSIQNQNRNHSQKKIFIALVVLRQKSISFSVRYLYITDLHINSISH